MAYEEPSGTDNDQVCCSDYRRIGQQTYEGINRIPIVIPLMSSSDFTALVHLPIVVFTSFSCL